MTMERSELERIVREAIVENTGNTPESVTDQTTLGIDLGMDDVDVFEVIVDVELDLGVNVGVSFDLDNLDTTFKGLCDAFEKVMP